MSGLELDYVVNTVLRDDFIIVSLKIYHWVFSIPGNYNELRFVSSNRSNIIVFGL